jgi:VanZ family protein
MGRLVALTGRVTAWALAVAVALLSVVPANFRPVTDMPHDFEHFAIFLATGVAFGFGYSRRPFAVAVMLVLFAAAVEIAQIFAPDRHARLSDFVVDALAVCAGATLGAALGRVVAPTSPRQTAQ